MRDHFARSRAFALPPSIAHAGHPFQVVLPVASSRERVELRIGRQPIPLERIGEHEWGVDVRVHRAGAHRWQVLRDGKAVYAGTLAVDPFAYAEGRRAVDVKIGDLPRGSRERVARRAAR